MRAGGGRGAAAKAGEIPLGFAVLDEPRRPFAVPLAGVLWGMVAVAAGRGPHTQLNDSYHRVMIVLLGATLILLLTPLGRSSLGHHRDP